MKTPVHEVAEEKTAEENPEEVQVEDSFEERDESATEQTHERRLSPQEAERVLQSIVEFGSMNIHGLPSSWNNERYSKIPKPKTYNENSGVIVFEHDGQVLAAPSSDKKREVLQVLGYKNDGSIGVPHLNNPDYYTRGRNGRNYDEDKWNNLINL